jgi:hypothetical protein
MTKVIFENNTYKVDLSTLGERSDYFKILETTTDNEEIKIFRFEDVFNMILKNELEFPVGGFVSNRERYIYILTGLNYFQADNLIKKLYEKVKTLLLENFDFCLYRYTYAHSWYKYGSVIGRIDTVPVLGNTQEPSIENDLYDNEGTLFKPTDVLWHFQFGRDEWFNPMSEDLREIIEENGYYTELRNFHHKHKTKMAYWDEKEIEKFERSKEIFKPIYEGLKKSAENIIKNILENDFDIPNWRNPWNEK